MYKTETNKAVLFNREKDSKFLWIPKSVINGDWITDKNQKQIVKVKYPLKLQWKSKRFVIQIIENTKKKLIEFGYKESKKKPSLFYKKLKSKEYRQNRTHFNLHFEDAF